MNPTAKDERVCSVSDLVGLCSGVVLVCFIVPGMITLLLRGDGDVDSRVAALEAILEGTTTHGAPPLQAPYRPPPLQVVESSRFRGDSETHYYLDHSGAGVASASSYWSDAFRASYATDDDDVDTAWSSSHEGADASLTVTFDTPTTITRVGARSRDMVNAYTDSAYQTDDSVVKSFKLYVDDAPVALCNMTGSYDTRVAHPLDPSLPKVVPPRGSGAAWERMHYCEIREVSGYAFRLEVEDTLPGPVNNTGFVEIELMERIPVPESMTISHLSACATSDGQDTQFAWGDALFSFDMAPGKSFWDPDVYIPGKESYSNTVSGSWLCSVASSSADAVGIVQYVDTDPFTYADLLPVRSALTMEGNLTKPWPTSSTSGPQFGNTFMSELNAFCTDVIRVEATSTLATENKFLLTFLCELFYANAMLYRVEAFLAPVSDGLTLSLPADNGITKKWVDDVFGFDSECTANCRVKVGPVTLTRPFGRYLYNQQKPVYEALASSGNALAQYLKGQSGVIWYDGYVGSYETHYKAAMDGAPGASLNALPVKWLGNGFFPPNYRICPTSQAFFKKLVRMKSKQTGESLLCSSVIQKMVRSVDGLLGIEIDLRKLSQEDGTEVSDTAITDGNSSMCDSSSPHFFGDRFRAQFTEGGIYTSIKPTLTPPYDPPPGFPPPMNTSTAMGVFGVTHMTGKTFMGIYSSYVAIQNLHVPQMDRFCKTRGFNYTLYPLGYATFQMIQYCLTFPEMANFSKMWDAIGEGDPDHPALGSANSLYAWDVAAHVEAAIKSSDPKSVIDSSSFLNQPAPLVSVPVNARDGVARMRAAISRSGIQSVIDSASFLNHPMASASVPTSIAYVLAGLPVGIMEAKHMGAHKDAVLGVESVYVM